MRQAPGFARAAMARPERSLAARVSGRCAESAILHIGVWTGK